MPTATPTRPTPTADPHPDRPRRSIARLLVAVAVVLTLLASGIAWYLFRPAPDAVDIQAAVDGTTETSGDTAAATASADVSGTWAVDTTVATFSVTDTTGTFVGFRVAEELANLGAVEAVGRTPEVTGTVTLDGTTLTAGEITADLTAMVSDESRREDAIQEALGTSTSPTATFTVTEAVDLGSDLSDGQVVDVTVPGTLTVNGVSRTVDVTMQVVRSGETVVVTGTTPVTFADFDVATPTSPIVVSLDDAGTIEFQLYLTRA
ncbi:YceI family protein [Euzebya sp.]|uniref:YceI family protein n=1 Tax=Euzebya sp. TaxID=1971409 RepID=UPI003514ED38